MSFSSIIDHRPIIEKLSGGTIKFQKISVFPEGISNSSRFAVFPEVVDTV